MRVCDKFGECEFFTLVKPYHAKKPRYEKKRTHQRRTISKIMSSSESMMRGVLLQQVTATHEGMMRREILIGLFTGLLLFCLLFAKEICQRLKPYFVYIQLIVRIIKRGSGGNDAPDAPSSSTSSSPSTDDKYIFDTGFETEISVGNAVRNVMFLYLCVFLVTLNICGDLLRLHLFPTVTYQVITM